MKNGIWVVLGIVVIVILAIIFLTPDNTEQEIDPIEDEEVEIEERTVEGEISEIDTEQVALDGPTVITVVSDNGTSTRVEVPSMGILLCEASEDIADVFALEVGQRIAVRGEVTSEGAVLPCESNSHYLRVVEAS